MKALLEAHGAPYHGTHNIAHLLGNIRRNDPELRESQFSIPPDVYTAYEGDQQYSRRTAPRITEFPDHLKRTAADAERIMERAREVRRLREAQDQAKLPSPDRHSPQASGEGPDVTIQTPGLPSGQNT